MPCPPGMHDAVVVQTAEAVTPTRYQAIGRRRYRWCGLFQEVIVRERPVPADAE
jgi:hypothetical protein